MFDPTNDPQRFDEKGPEHEPNSNPPDLSRAHLPSNEFLRQCDHLHEAVVDYSKGRGARFRFKENQLAQISTTNRQLEWALSVQNEEAIDSKPVCSFVKEVLADPDRSLLIIGAGPVSSQKEHFVTPVSALLPREGSPDTWGHLKVNPFCHTESWAGVVFEWHRKGLRIHPLVSERAYEQAIEETYQVSKEIEHLKGSGIGIVSQLSRSSIILGLILREIYSREDAFFGVTGLRLEDRGKRFTMGVAAVKSISSTKAIEFAVPLEEHVHQVEVEHSPLGILTSRWLGDEGSPFGLN